MHALPQAATPSLIRLRDYRAPAWRVEAVELDFDLGIDASEVLARLHLRRNPAQDAPLRLDGENLQLLAIALDGRTLSADEYRYDDSVLVVDGTRDGSVLETRVRLRPAANTALEGLYLSGPRETGFLLTQCEAEGFRHITFFPDRPDVLSRYTVTLRADRARFPVLLAGGNPDGAGELEGGRHWARFVDPHPKPSYLFALVAGHLEVIERGYVTADGRAVQLKIWAEADAIERCHYAMDALERAMRWDEQTYGRNYDLDVFHVVATHDFNMGAMENKGLNIFNAKCLLAEPDSTTDEEYRHVEAVVAHEYFHNWSGNRVTCRDWFQLSLKEGLTVFREQSFSADMNSAPLKRIDDVALLRRAQFPEDAGPLAHPVRPAQYSEINNFYTATVYEKGAELVRMLAGTLGRDGFRRGMDRYFERNDGHAATLEDFLAALGEANGTDLTPYLAWYAQAGTPRLKAHGHYDAAAQTYTLTLAQQTPAGHGAEPRAPLPIPVKLALFSPHGDMLPLHMDGQTSKPAIELVVVLDRAERNFVFTDVAAAPVPSLLRGFSAPVILACDYTPDELALLLAHDVDGFNRWEASQQLAARAYEELRDGTASAALHAWCDALARLFDSAAVDDALLADLLTPPGEIELAERETAIDPQRILQSRQALQRQLAERLGAENLQRRYLALLAQTGIELDAASQARRRLQRRVLELLALLDPVGAGALAATQYRDAPGMTDRLAALSVLVRSGAAQAAAALRDYRERYAGNALALDKWFAVQAQLPGEPALDRVRQLERDDAFTLKNPNRVQSLLGAFVRSNPSGFHRADGAGYRLLAERLVALDALNPQVAARLATAFNGWQRLEPRRREAAQAAIVELARQPGLSRNLGEIIDSVLNH
ncbi:aminopeptidase N [Rhodanobacter thiooxydans]|uniref:Aminopeptidase N n=1 Tax=Rhodanobacter thiooxydans TaxID=416169 RepID=A0A154QKL7_9GAMM|nr:aminopeptidase N [Rhodanobacter thiooxydans]EIL98606.1 aminopeptidase N [Rhodanobacter thiooxydans LCS2]KZC24297.1 aminopeptidase N [Rhodanobacter thiooxydans]MCW0201377.1 aminopeptidase N [Rhodanobacter thiooxydans]